MRQQNMTSLFFSEENFLAVVNAIDHWTKKAYGLNSNKVSNENILEIMKRIYGQHDSVTNKTLNSTDVVLGMNKQVIRKSLELISASVVPQTRQSQFRLGEEHIIPKSDKPFLPSEELDGKNNTMELYEKESQRRQAELDAAPTLTVPLITGSSTLPTIMEDPEESQDETSERLSIHDLSNSEQHPPVLAEEQKMDAAEWHVSDQAENHMQAILNILPGSKQSGTWSAPYSPGSVIPKDTKRLSDSAYSASESKSIMLWQKNFEMLLKNVETMLANLQSKTLQSALHPNSVCSEIPKRDIQVFSSAERNLNKRESICQFSLPLLEGDTVKKIVVPKCSNITPYLKVSLDDQIKLAKVRESAVTSEFMILDVEFEAIKETNSFDMTLCDLSGNLLYPEYFDIINISAVQTHEAHLIVETGLHHLQEGEAIRLLDVECEDIALKNMLQKKNGFAVSLIDHAHFAISETGARAGMSIQIRSMMKLRRQVFVEYHHA